MSQVEQSESQDLSKNIADKSFKWLDRQLNQTQYHTGGMDMYNDEVTAAALAFNFFVGTPMLLAGGGTIERIITTGNFSGGDIPAVAVGLIGGALVASGLTVAITDLARGKL